jgi:hypothetical protein
MVLSMENILRLLNGFKIPDQYQPGMAGKLNRCILFLTAFIVNEESATIYADGLSANMFRKTEENDK